MPNTDKKPTDKDIVKALQKEIQDSKRINSSYALLNLNLLKETVDLINRLQAENERLQETTKNMSAYVKGNNWGLVSFVEFCKNLKAEAYKECIEKVKKKGVKVGVDEICIFENTLYNLLKEMVGDNNET